MNDPPGVPSPLGIEVVEWFSEGGDNLTVRVTGRWRRRRPGWSAQPTLVIEAPGRRYRFPAMPEPPSLTGTPPGMWRISFTVPAALAPELGGRAWLQFGAVVVPLPAAVEPMSAGEPTAEAALPEGQAADEPAQQPAAEAPQPSPELEAESERRRAIELEADAELSELASRIASLERELDETRDEAGRLSTSLAEQEQQRRTAEQRAHAERAQRLDVSRQLAERNRDAERSRQALGDLAAAEERIRRLERELADARRRIDEAEQLAAAAVSARERAERELASAASAVADGAAGPPNGEEPAERERLDVEQGLVARRESAGSRVPDEPASTPESASAPAGDVTPPAATIPATEALIAALRAELTLRTGAEAALRSRLVESEARLAAREHLERRTGSTLSELRRELDGLRGAITRERAAREAAEQQVAFLEADLELQRDRTTEASAAIGELRLALESLRAEAALPVAEPEPMAAEPEPVVAPEPEAFVEPEPEALVEPEPVVEPEPEAVVEPEPEPEALVESEPVVEPEPEAVVEPEPEPEPEPEAVVEPGPVVEPEPEAIVEPEAMAPAPEALVPPETPPAPVEPPSAEAPPVVQPVFEPETRPEPEAVEPEPQAEPEAAAEPEAQAEPEPEAIAPPVPFVPEPDAAPQPEPEPEPTAETVVPVFPVAAEPTPEEPSAPPEEPSAPTPEEPSAAAEPEAQAETEAETEDPKAGADVEPERLSDALIRLRELIAPIEPAGEGESTPKPVTTLGDRARPKWLRPGLVSLARSDPEQAGRALVAMMAAQGRINREPIAYDVVLGKGHGCAHVTVYENQVTRVTFDEDPRPVDEVAFQLIGGYAQLARRFTAGWLRTQLHFGVARLKGKDQKRVTAVDALIDTDLGLSGLYHAGVRFAPDTSLMLLSRVIDPSWTEGVRFALAYGTASGPSSYLVVGAEKRLQVADSAPDGRALTTITGPPGSLEQVLDGAQGEDVVVAGEDWPLTSLRKWIKRAQSG